jgi:excisionase family DNA binding protein
MRLAANWRQACERAEPALVTVQAVAAGLGVSTATVYGLCRRGELPHARVSNAIRIRAEALALFIEGANR